MFARPVKASDAGFNALVRGDGVVGLGVLQEVAQRDPGTRLSFGDVAGGLENRSFTQVLLGVGLIIFGQLQTQVQVRLEDVGLGGD